MKQCRLKYAKENLDQIGCKNTVQGMYENLSICKHPT